MQVELEKDVMDLFWQELQFLKYYRNGNYMVSAY